jgi:hypothetical protein
VPEASDDAAWVGAALLPRVGSVASNLDISPARSLGTAGAAGAAGLANERTCWAWASADCC